MERKTIGGLIAALRKANGMTQKELAERLNVSDKTVSRWERDDGAPDLSVIPVIAEVFGVTCDELLRGERKSIAQRTEPSEEAQTSPKGEKERQRLLTVTLSRYKTRSFIAMGIAGAGLIAAMIGNFGFLRAYIGFLVGAVFYLASVICQAVFVNEAFLSVADDSLNGAEIGQFKRTVIRMAEYSIGLTVVLLGGSLPLIVFPYDTYSGLTGESWLGHGAAYGILTLLLCCIVCRAFNAALLKKGVYTLGEKAQQSYRHNHKLQRKCALILAAVLLITYCVHFFVTNRWNPVALSDGTVFHDYESFVEFMEEDIPYYGDSSGLGYISEPTDTVYYDEFGNEISEEEALKETLRVADGTPEGKVVCEYIARNQTVCAIRFTETDGSLLPITVVTDYQLQSGKARFGMINAAFTVLYCLEMIAAAVVYFKKRAK